MRAALLLVAIVAAATAGGCDRSRDVVIGEDYHRVVDPLPATVSGADVLFVLDNSVSMAAEQAALIDAAGTLFAQLETDLGGPPDLHVAVISTDVGLGRDDVAGCRAASDDGRFLIGGGTACGIDGGYLIDRDDGAGGRDRNFAGDLLDAFSCAADIGATGCGFEQPFAAIERALDGRYPDHDGFLRDDALLLIVIASDEDDCSAFDSTLFGDPAAGPTSPLGPRTSFRCFEFGVECDPDEPRRFGVKHDCRSREDSPYVTPVGHYADFLADLKSTPGLVMLAGMHAPTEPVVVSPDLLDPTRPAVELTCYGLGTSVAASPAIRIDQLLDQFPSRYVLASMCDDPMDARLYRVARAAGGVMTGRPCLLGRVDADTSTERCRAFDVDPSGVHVEVPGCRADEAGCFEIRPSSACTYAPGGLEASYRGSLAAGHRLVVDCLARIE